MHVARDFLVRYRWVILLYLATRGMLLLVAFIDGTLRHRSFTHELSNWDGLWYRELAHRGYPASVPHSQSTLGFFPLYPMLMWVGAHVFRWTSAHSFLWCLTVAGIVISGIGGLVAVVLVQKLGTGWWGAQIGRRAAMCFCLFPGSVVFSMVYAEAIMLPLAIGCLIALERRRWITAGILAGFATALEPEALVLIGVSLLACGRELQRQSVRLKAARRSLFAPLLSLTGVAAVAGFFWAWSGTPFANLLAQRYGWNERSDPFALVHLSRSLADQISFAHFNHPTINLNLVVGLLGAILLIVLLVLLFKSRATVSPEALLWTAGISLIAFTAEYTPPNPRLMITAFPAIMVVGRYVRGWTWRLLALGSGIALAGMSALTFIGPTLRP